MGMPERARDETVAAALAAAASLVTPALVTRSCRAAVDACGGRAGDCALVEHPQAAGWHCERSEPVIW